MTKFTPDEYFKYMCKDPIAVQHYVNLQQQIDAYADLEVAARVTEEQNKAARELIDEIGRALKNKEPHDDIIAMIEGSDVDA